MIISYTMSIEGIVIGLRAPDFSLEDSDRKMRSLYKMLESGPLLLAFYPKDLGLVCSAQLCNYQDHFNDFKKLGIHIVGISKNPPESHKEFIKRYSFEFTLLSDTNKEITKKFGCSSLLMFGGTSRAVFIISKSGIIRYRYVEPTTITHRKANELIEIISDLKSKNLLS
jgi:peroxiredoxin